MMNTTQNRTPFQVAIQFVKKYPWVPLVLGVTLTMAAVAMVLIAILAIRFGMPRLELAEGARRAIHRTCHSALNTNDGLDSRLGDHPKEQSEVAETPAETNRRAGAIYTEEMHDKARQRIWTEYCKDSFDPSVVERASSDAELHKMLREDRKIARDIANRKLMKLQENSGFFTCPCFDLPQYDWDYQDGQTRESVNAWTDEMKRLLKQQFAETGTHSGWHIVGVED